MKIALAFKIAGFDNKWSKLIAQLTQSKYSHVELWMDGPPAQAHCISSREGSGVSWAYLNLAPGHWDIIPLDIELEDRDYLRGFCDGSVGKSYDYQDLLDALMGLARNDFPIGRFCSGFCVEALQKTIGLESSSQYWTVSPGKLYDIVSK